MSVSALLLISIQRQRRDLRVRNALIELTVEISVQREFLLRSGVSRCERARPPRDKCVLLVPSEAPIRSATAVNLRA